LIDATIDGADYTILSTHLESGKQPGLAELRAAQATEIATVLGAAAPAIVMGDLNDVPGSLMYNVMLGAGFTDVWAALRPGAIGYTCCHVDDLSNPRATFYQRIDQIWTRGIGHPRAGAQGTISITGKVPASRLDGPEYLIWPSDHAGVVANLLLAPAWGVRGD
jgi:endonuclease/exonuclease/phosphatase family metal-dependent hydrolase